MNTYASGSVEYIKARITAPPGVDPTQNVVQMAFTSDVEPPVAADWRTADWDPGLVNTARCLYGPTALGGTGQLSAGVYTVWVQILGGVEKPIKRVGTIKVE